MSLIFPNHSRSYDRTLEATIAYCSQSQAEKEARGYRAMLEPW